MWDYTPLNIRSLYICAISLLPIHGERDGSHHIVLFVFVGLIEMFLRAF